MSETLARKRGRYNLRSSIQLYDEDEPAELPVPTRKRPYLKNLMMLNDHCLLELFNYLKPIDLANIVRVNKRLNALISKYFLLKYGLQFTQKFDFAQCGKHIKLNMAKAFLRIFGYQIVSLKLPHEFLYHNEQTIHVLLSSVQKYCTNLKELTIIGFNMHGLNKEFFKNLQLLTLDECFVNREWCEMKHLKVLTLNKVIFRRWPLAKNKDTTDRGSQFESSDYDYDSDNFSSDDSNVFSESESDTDSYGSDASSASSDNDDYDEYFFFRRRRRCRYIAPKYLKAIPVRSFGALKEIRLTQVNLRDDCVTKLIDSNSAIKCLSIVKCINVSTKFFAAASKLTDLVEFEFKQNSDVSDSDLNYLFTMNKLQILKFTCHNFSASNLLNGFIENGVAINHLELGYGRFDDATSQIITKIPSIKILKLNTMEFYETHILTIVKGLEALEELHLQTYEYDDYNDIQISQNGVVDIVRAAGKLTCLKIDLADFKLDHETYQAILNVVQSRVEQIGLELTVYGNGDESFVPTGVLNENDEMISLNQLNRSDGQLFDDLSIPNYYSSGSGSDTDDSNFGETDDDGDEN